MIAVLQFSIFYLLCYLKSKDR